MVSWCPIKKEPCRLQYIFKKNLQIFSIKYSCNTRLIGCVLQIMKLVLSWSFHETLFFHLFLTWIFLEHPNLLIRSQAILLFNTSSMRRNANWQCVQKLSDIVQLWNLFNITLENDSSIHSRCKIVIYKFA